MRLGIVMMGTGVCAAANAGVLRLLEERAIEIYAVCGMQDGAWTAALHVTGYDAQGMEKALVHGVGGSGRLFQAQHSSRAILSGKNGWISDGKRIDRLIKIQTGEKLLGLCGRRGIFPCRLASSGKRVIFTTCAYACGRACELAQQATTGFAARAAMANPPFLAPLPWAGTWLLAEEDAAWAAQQLIQMGADRVLMINPRAQSDGKMNALELASARRSWAMDNEETETTTVLHVCIPQGVHALDYQQIESVVQAGYEAAQAGIDAALQKLGMTQCRILPFRARTALRLSRR